MTTDQSVRDAALKQMFDELLTALGDLSFECFSPIAPPNRPSRETYNRTFAVLERARALKSQPAPPVQIDSEDGPTKALTWEESNDLAQIISEERMAGHDTTHMAKRLMAWLAQLPVRVSQPAPGLCRTEAFLLGARIMRENLAALMEVKRFLRRGEILDGFNNEIAETIRDTPLPPPPAGAK